MTRAKIKEICLARWAEMNRVSAEFGRSELPVGCLWSDKNYSGCQKCRTFKTVDEAVKDIKRWTENHFQHEEKVRGKDRKQAKRPAKSAGIKKRR